MTQPTDLPFLLTGDPDPMISQMQAAARQRGLRLRFTVTEDGPTPDHIRLDELTSDQYDALHTRLWNAETACDAWGAKAGEQQQRAEQAEASIATFAAIFRGFGNLLATSSRDWAEYRVDAWLWAVVLGWDCEETEHDDTCIHGVMEEMADAFGWDEAAVAKARRYRATVRAALDEHQEQP